MLIGNNNQDNPQIADIASASGHVFDVSGEDFEQKVLKASMQTPVLVDFWAPWCGPCKALGPVLEKLVNDAGGKIKMAKVNIDENQELAQALRIQSVPTVYAFLGGRPIDAFQGSLPESQIQAFIDKAIEAARQIGPDALDIPEALKGAALALAEGDLGGAQGIYIEILQIDPKNVAAFAGMIRVLIAAGQIDQAKEMADNAPEDIASNPAFAEVKTIIELADNAPSGEEAEFIKKIETNADDHQSRFELSGIQFSGGKKEEAIDNLLYIIEKKRDWNDEAARQKLLKYFEALGHTDPLTVESRKRLSSILFS